MLLSLDLLGHIPYIEIIKDKETFKQGEKAMLFEVLLDGEVQGVAGTLGNAADLASMLVGQGNGRVEIIMIETEG